MKKLKEILTLFNKVIYYINIKFKKQHIQVYDARLTGDDNFIDIRYSLTRPDLIPKDIDIILIDTDNGEKLRLMKFTKIGTVKTRHNLYRTNGILLFYNKFKKVNADTNFLLEFGSLQSDIFNLNN